MRDRLKQLLSTMGINQSTFASSIGLTPSAITDFFKGRSSGLSSTALVKVVGQYNVNLNWLLTGDGDMFLSGERQSGSSEPVRRRDPEVERIADLVEALDVTSRNEIADYAQYKSERSGLKGREATPRYRLAKPAKAETVDVPLLGQIAAGNPIFADDHIEKIIKLPQSVVPPRGRRLFALQVRGESMIGAGIQSGDYALLREVVDPREEVPPGHIAAAVIGSEATLKRVFIENGTIILKPENPAFEPIVCENADTCRIIGSLVLTWRWWNEEEEE